LAEPDELTLTIARHLEIDGEYFEHVEPWDIDRIAEVRSAGRKAARLLGWKIVTGQSRHLTDKGRVVVMVVIREYPDEETRQRLSERGDLLIRNSWEKRAKRPDD
jgi:hypothetical protein